MRGTHSVRVRDRRRVTYSFELRRNITILRGDSGTGKTTLYEMVADHTRNGSDSAVTIACDKECVALLDMDWKGQLKRTDDSIVVVDEGVPYIKTPEFSDAIRETSNYYLIISRLPLHALPYSVEEVYEIVSSGTRAHRFRRVHEHGPRFAYSPHAPASDNRYTALLTEDSGSGLQFYTHRLGDAGIACESSHGRDGIAGWLRNWLSHNAAGRVFVVADGAAFGPAANEVFELQSTFHDRVTVCLPESFEWLLLKGVLGHRRDVAAVLDNPSDWVESREYYSWERFFERLLEEKTLGTALHYDKSSLADAYAAKQNADRVMELICHQNVS